MNVRPGEGTAFHYPEIPVNNLVHRIERARRVARLLDNNNFLFRDLSAIPSVSEPGRMSISRYGRYLYPAILSTVYEIFIEGNNSGGHSGISIMSYAGPSHREPLDKQCHGRSRR
jgi:hypothetical protein